MAYQLLDEPLLGIEFGSGERIHVSLCTLLAHLSIGTELEMTGLQAHQRLAWHSFVCQLAAIALHRDGVKPGGLKLGRTSEEWRRLLVAAASAEGSGESAFELVVEDTSQAAFLQPPLKKGELKELKNEHALPAGELDTLITAKNHDVKVARLGHPQPEHWVYALIALQTTEGFLGAGNYGIARMNGGFSSRPGLGYSPSLGSAARFCRDVPLLLGLAINPPPLYPDPKPGSEALLWLHHWDGTKSSPLYTLHPLFIEICRRLRLVPGADGSIEARRGSSKAARVNGKEAFGNTADPWVPVEASKDGKATALTLSERGYEYRKLCELLFKSGAWTHGVAGHLQRSDGAHPVLIAQALVRGQGKTGGWHERVIPIKEKALRFYLEDDHSAAFGERAERWVEMAGLAQHKVLKPALLALVQGGPDQLDFKDERPGPTLRAFDQTVDGEFFKQLFELSDASEEVASEAWAKWLFSQCQSQLKQAFDSNTGSVTRRYRAEAKALTVLFGAAKNHLNIKFKQPESTGEAAQETV